jgi:pimeloyl-ACP methyl ester carboxylesterase
LLIGKRGTVNNDQKSGNRQIRQTHLPPRPIPTTELTLVPAIAPAQIAVIFVHGYRGGPRTWDEFPILLPLSNDAVGLDLIFYNHDGVYSELDASALLLEAVLESIATAPTELLNRALPSSLHRASGFCYKKLVVAAHSLGAVMTRSALLFSLERGKQWAERCDCIFFAPAHSGAHVRRLAAEAASGLPFLHLLFAAVTFRSPLIAQLARDSPELNELRTRAAADGTSAARPKQVVIAQRESVVSNARFPGDPIPSVIAGATHTSVCKPTTTVPDPLKHVEKLLWTH